MNPTALVPGARKDLLDRLPEAERAVTDREVRRDLEPTLLDIDEELTPALRALAHPGLEADELLLALGGRADQHQHAFGIVFHPGLQVDPVRPHVHVSSRREIALLPGVVIRLPRRRQQRVEALRPPRPLRQDRRGEADFRLRPHVAPVAHLCATDPDRPDPGLDRAMWTMAVTHDAVAAVR